MQVLSNAECSPWSILQYFWPAFSNNWSWNPIFGRFESGSFTQVLLYYWHNSRNTISLHQTISLICTVRDAYVFKALTVTTKTKQINCKKIVTFFCSQIWPTLERFYHSILRTWKLEDLKVLNRSHDLLNNVKIGQCQLIMKHNLF